MPAHFLPFASDQFGLATLKVLHSLKHSQRIQSLSLCTNSNSNKSKRNRNLVNDFAVESRISTAFLNRHLHSHCKAKPDDLAGAVAGVHRGSLQNPV